MTTTNAPNGTGAAVELRPSGRLELRPDQEFWTDMQISALRALGVKGATIGDFAVYMHFCARTQLDPFAKQVYMIPRQEKERWRDEHGNWQERWITKQTIQVGIDGFRVIRDRAAERTGTTCELEDTIWYDADGGKHEVWLSDEPPAACKVVLVKWTSDGRAHRFPAQVRTRSYMATNAKGDAIAQWRTMPDHMIEKCAEAFASRRAYPQDLSGVHIAEEMMADPDRLSGHVAVTTRVSAAEIADRVWPPADDEVAQGEIVPDDPAENGHAPTDSAGLCPPALATEVNAHFKRLGFTAKEHTQVNATAAKLAGRDSEVGKVADLTEAQALLVRAELERCKTREDLVALLATGELHAEPKPGDSEAADD